MTAETVRRLARECGFEMAGVARAGRLPEADWFFEWVRLGMAGEMKYLTGPRAALRGDPRALLPSARSVICVGKLYNTPHPHSTEFHEPGRAWISRYAWGRDYHKLMRRGLRRLAQRLQEIVGRRFEWRATCDSAPLLERALARQAGLGWIGKNSCLIHERSGSWYFLGELLVPLEIEPDRPAPDRCGSCTRCIEACPTGAIVPTGRSGGPAYTVDSRRCISYFTIELRGPLPSRLGTELGSHLFGCDICQDVCPWNRRAPVTAEPDFQPRHFAPPLEWLQSLDAEGFRRSFAGSPVRRVGWEGFRRNLESLLEAATRRCDR
ncbi:MAG: tRNA epoxyqueuosine(34) reductase QueG [Bryobacteraceae bacterium]